MSEANIFVHHSVTGPSGDMEGIPNAIMEAMGMELPVLSSIHSGIPELVENGENGFLVQEFDVESYAERINDIYDWELQPKNRTKVLEAFEQEVHKKRLLDIYTSVRQ